MSLLSRLEKLESTSGGDDLPFAIFVFPEQSDEEAVAEWDLKYPGTRDPSRPMLFVHIRGIGPAGRRGEANGPC